MKQINWYPKFPIKNINSNSIQNKKIKVDKREIFPSRPLWEKVLGLEIVWRMSWKLEPIETLSKVDFHRVLIIAYGLNSTKLGSNWVGIQINWCWINKGVKVTDEFRNKNSVDG